MRSASRTSSSLAAGSGEPDVLRDRGGEEIGVVVDQRDVRADVVERRDRGRRHRRRRPRRAGRGSGSAVPRSSTCPSPTGRRGRSARPARGRRRPSAPLARLDRRVRRGPRRATTGSATAGACASSASMRAVAARQRARATTASITGASVSCRASGSSTSRAAVAAGRPVVARGISATAAPESRTAGPSDAGHTAARRASVARVVLAATTSAIAASSRCQATSWRASVSVVSTSSPRWARASTYEPSTPLPGERPGRRRAASTTIGSATTSAASGARRAAKSRAPTDTSRAVHSGTRTRTRSSTSASTSSTSEVSRSPRRRPSAEPGRDERDEGGVHVGASIGEATEGLLVGEEAFGIAQHRPRQAERAHADDRHHQRQHRRLVGARVISQPAVAVRATPEAAESAPSATAPRSARRDGAPVDRLGQRSRPRVGWRRPATAARVRVHDVVGELDERRPVRDHDHGPRPGELADHPRQHGLGRGVEVRGRLVEEHHGAVADQHPGEREPGAFAGREAGAVLAERGLRARRGG